MKKLNYIFDKNLQNKYKDEINNLLKIKEIMEKNK